MMDKASILAELEQWPGVVKTYRQILNVQPVHKKARLGWEDALVNLVGQKQIDQFKKLIRHHLNARQFAHAQDIFSEARNVLHNVTDFDDLFLPLRRELEDQPRRHGWC